MIQLLKRFIKFLLSFFKSTKKESVKLIKNEIPTLRASKPPKQAHTFKSKVSPYIEFRSHKRNFKHKKINF